MRATLVTAPDYHALHLVYTARRLFQARLALCRGGPAFWFVLNGLRVYICVCTCVVGDNKRRPSHTPPPTSPPPPFHAKQKDNWIPSPQEKMDMNRRFAEGYKLLMNKYARRVGRLLLLLLLIGRRAVFLGGVCMCVCMFTYVGMHKQNLKHTHNNVMAGTGRPSRRGWPSWSSASSTIRRRSTNSACGITR